MTYRTREEKLAIAVDKLRKYYGIKGAPDNASAITAFALSEISARSSPRPAAGAGTPAPSIESSLSSNPELSAIMQAIIDVNQGAYMIKDIIRILNDNIPTSGDRRTAVETNLKNLVQIITDFNLTENQILPFPPSLIATGLDKLAIKYPRRGQNAGSNQKLLVSDDTTINSRLREPTKQAPNLSIILLNSAMTSLVTRSANACSLFFNSVPSIQMSRAVPYVEVNILQPLPALDESADTNLLAPSLYKFLLGGVSARAGSVLRTLQTANSSSNVPGDNSNSYTLLGMEAFTSPQILQNGDDVTNEAYRVVPVIDKFRPFMSINGFSTSEVMSYSANGYRTAQLSLTLHDRSRMAEIAPLIKSEFRGNTQIIVEYGWSHPDGNDLLSESSDSLINYYGWLINGMRRREKYQIVNNSFTFNENGEVSISLNLATVGFVEMNTVNIADGVESISGLNEIEQARAAIARVAERFETSESDESGSSSRRSREISGVQILEPASDTFNNLVLDNDQRQDLRRFLSAIAPGTILGRIPEVQNLSRILENLYGPRGEGGSARNLRRDVLQKVAAKINSIKSFVDSYPIPRSDSDSTTTAAPSGGRGARAGRRGRRGERTTGDPFLPLNFPQNIPNNFRGRLVSPASGGRTSVGTTSTSLANLETNDGIEPRDIPNAVTSANSVNVSLATIISNFIIEPLTKTGLYDEVQVIFYPFNEYAGYASRINIAQFSVDLAFFQERYARYRLENISRTGTMSLGQFWTFLQSNIIDDLAARSYGLYDSDGGALLRNPNREETEDGALPSDAVPADDSPTFTARLNRILATTTPAGDWRPPQLAYLMETLPSYAEEAELDGAGTARKSILRFHIYDRQSTAYGTIGDILLAERRRILNIPTVPSGAQDINGNPVAEVREQYRRDLLNQVSGRGLIREIGETRRYEVIGGFNAIKSFIYDNMPYIQPGIQGSLVLQANLASQQDSAAASLNMINAPRAPSVMAPNGTEPGNLPLQIIPTELQLETFGCPLVSFAGQYFVDFNTGTSADDIYAINGIEHTLGLGEFKTSIKMRPITGYGQYRNFLRQLDEFSTEAERIERVATGTPPAGGTRTSST